MMIRTILGGIVGGCVIGGVVLPTLAPRIPIAQSITAAWAEDNSGSEFPGQRVGGGTRGGCARGARPLIALNPVTNLGVTAATEPMLYFVMPSLGAEHPVELLMLDDEGQILYETRRSVPVAATLVGIEIPAAVLALEQPYHWYFAVLCDETDPSQDLVVEGWLKRVAGSQDLAEIQEEDIPTQLNQAAIAQAGAHWSDAIAILAALYQTYPDHPQVQAQWNQLLTDLGLDALSALL